jgi:hypothetical protein
VTEYLDGAPNDKQAYSQAVAARGVKALKCFENPWQPLWRDADPGVVDIDSHVSARSAASDEDAAAGFGVFYGVAYQIAKDPAKEQGIAHDASLGRARPHIDTPSQRCVLVLVAQPPE